MNWLIVWAKYKYYIIALLAIIVIIIIILSIKKKSNSQNSPLPTDSAGGPLTQAEAEVVRKIVLDLHDDMDGINWLFWSRNTKVYMDLATLSDKFFVAVYNDFNNLFGSEKNGTLKNWIQNDLFYKGTKEGGAYPILMERFSKLNLQ